MSKTKLFAGICAGAAVIAAAGTALTLFLSGSPDSKEKPIHQYSPNEQVVMSFESAFNSMSASADEFSAFVTELSNSKTAANIGFTINSADGHEDLAGTGGEIEFQFDSEAEAAAIILNATIQSTTIIDGTVYVDKNELIAAFPTLYDGIVKMGLDNLEQDIQNSFMGQALLESMDMDVNELVKALEFSAENMDAYAPNIEFDSETFCAGLSDTLTQSYQNAMASMTLEDLGKQTLNGGSYQCYNATITIDELSYIARDAVKYCLQSPEFQSLVDQVLEYYVESTGTTSPELAMISGATLGQYAALVDVYWGQLLSGIKQTTDENVKFTIYISDDVELAGLQFNVYNEGNKLYFDNDLTTDASDYITISYDCTGGKNLGDYTEISFKGYADSDYVYINYTSKNETNGDFDIELSFDTPADNFAITASGNFVADGEFFNLDVTSLKFIEDDKTIADIGFKCGFKPIDSITKPTGTPVYDIWTMDELGLEEFFNNIDSNLEELVTLID